MERVIDTHRSLERTIDRNLERNLERSLRQESANAQASFHSRTSTLLGTIDNHFEIPGGGANVPLLDAHGYRQQAAMLAAQQGTHIYHYFSRHFFTVVFSSIASQKSTSHTSYPSFEQSHYLHFLLFNLARILYLFPPFLTVLYTIYFLSSCSLISSLVHS